MIDLAIPEESYIAILPTGSYTICNPPVKDTDRDFVLLVDDINKFKDIACEVGYLFNEANELEYEHDYEEFDMLCMRKGIINIIVVDEWDFYIRWKQATDLAVLFNLVEKEHRVKLFKTILYPGIFDV